MFSEGKIYWESIIETEFQAYQCRPSRVPLYRMVYGFYVSPTVFQLGINSYFTIWNNMKQQESKGTERLARGNLVLDNTIEFLGTRRPQF